MFSINSTAPFDLFKLQYENFGLSYDGPKRILGAEEKAFRILAMREELEEYMEATTLVDQFDALIDFAIFTLGTAYRMGFTITSETATTRELWAINNPPNFPERKHIGFFHDRCKHDIDVFERADDFRVQSQHILILYNSIIHHCHLHGFPFLVGFLTVTKCNMQKQVGSNAKRGSFKSDLIKPEGWVGPEKILENILEIESLKYGMLRKLEGNTKWEL